MIPNRCPKATLFSHFAGGQQVCIPPWVVSLESAGLGLDWMVGWLVGWSVRVSPVLPAQKGFLKHVPRFASTQPPAFHATARAPRTCFGGFLSSACHRCDSFSLRNPTWITQPFSLKESIRTQGAGEASQWLQPPCGVLLLVVGGCWWQLFRWCSLLANKASDAQRRN